jgi:hypothetical protein
MRDVREAQVSWFQTRLRARLSSPLAEDRMVICSWVLELDRVKYLFIRIINPSYDCRSSAFCWKYRSV